MQSRDFGIEILNPGIPEILYYRLFSNKNDKKLSLEATLARKTALDGIPFKVLCTYSDLRTLLEAMGFKNLSKLAKILSISIYNNFNVICNSSDLRAGLEDMGFKNLPKWANKFRKIVLEYCKNVRISIISELSKKR